MGLASIFLCILSAPLQANGNSGAFLHPAFLLRSADALTACER
jgi:hypothetical protein